MSAAPSPHESSQSLAKLLEAQASAKEIEAFLDSLSPAQRVSEVRRITGKGVARLYAAVAEASPLTLDEIVPPGENGTRIYEGRNSLPLFSSFQKRFTRLEDGTIIGYNHQSMSVFTGPGYFVVKPPCGHGPHPTEPYFDYTAAPPIEPAGWPAYKPNNRGLSKAVYAGMHDFMRRVARGVMVGKAYKGGVEQDAYFSLTFPG